MLSTLRLIALAAVLAGILSATTAQVGADGIVIPSEPCPMPEDGDPPVYDCYAPFLPIKYHRVEVEIRDQVAEVRVDQAFENPGDTLLEATYVFPLPADAAVSDFTMLVDGEQLEGRLLDRDEAREIYEEIVRQQRDPALLEYVDRGVFQASVFPIPPHDERRVQISYTQVLERESGLVRFLYPLSTEEFSPQPIPDVSITVDIESTQPIRTVYSPSHDVTSARDGDHKATVSLEMSDVTPRSDFELLYSTSDDDIGLSLATHRIGEEAGYFLLLVSPKLEVNERDVADKDVVLVLDTSGSMEGEKLEQAKQAARYVIERLNTDDRFSIVAFDSSVRVAHDGLLPASAARADALDFIDSLQAGGSTNIHDALVSALGQLSSGDRPSLVIFLTDGLPTVGITDQAAIVDAVDSAAPRGVRLFTFGVGYDVNAVLLDELAQGQHGLSEYVRPDEDASTVVSGFYERVSDPVLSDIALDFGDVTAFDIYPNPLPDLFAGQQLIVAGRYEGSGTVDVTLSGTIDGEAKEYVYEGQSFPTSALDEGYVPRLWATRKIGFLLNSIRFEGMSDEIVEEIVELSKRFGIITPYTSFLVEEPGLTVEEAASSFERYAAPQLDMEAGAPVTGSEAFDTALEVGSLSGANSAYDAAGEHAAAARTIGGRTFLSDDGVWTDTAYEGGPTAKIGFGSDVYFDALRQRPDWGSYFSLGEEVIFVSDGRTFEIAPGDFPAIDLPAPVQPDDPVNPSALAPQPEEAGDSVPWLPVVGGAATVAVALTAAGWAWMRRRQQPIS